MVLYGINYCCLKNLKAINHSPRSRESIRLMNQLQNKKRDCHMSFIMKRRKKK